MLVELDVGADTVYLLHQIGAHRIARASIGNNFSAAHPHQAIRKSCGKSDFVQNDQCATAGVDKFTYQHCNAQLVARIERRDRFVRDKQRCSGCECACEMHACQFTTGETVSISMRQFA